MIQSLLRIAVPLGAPVRRLAVPFPQGVGVRPLGEPRLRLRLNVQAASVIERQEAGDVRIEVLAGDGTPEDDEAPDEVPLLLRKGPQRRGAAVVDVLGHRSVQVLLRDGSVQDLPAMVASERRDEVHLAGVLLAALDASLPADHAAVLHEVRYEYGCVGPGYAEGFRDAVLREFVGDDEILSLRYVPVAVQMEEDLLGKGQLAHGWRSRYRDLSRVDEFTMVQI